MAVRVNFSPDPINIDQLLADGNLPHAIFFALLPVQFILKTVEPGQYQCEKQNYHTGQKFQ
jgi:hypothetical protein